MFNLSPIYSACKSSNHTLFINHKISPDTNLHKTKHTQTSNTKFQRISPFSITPVKKARKARTRWYRGPFRRFINTRFFKKKYEKEMDRRNENFLKILYKCIIASTSDIWQHAAHTTDQLISPSC